MPSKSREPLKPTNAGLEVYRINGYVSEPANGASAKLGRRATVEPVDNYDIPTLQPGIV